MKCYICRLTIHSKSNFIVTNIFRLKDSRFPNISQSVIVHGKQSSRKCYWTYLKDEEYIMKFLQEN